MFVILPEQLGDDIPFAETEIVSESDFPSGLAAEPPMGGGPQLVTEVPHDPGEATGSVSTEMVDERQLDRMASELDDEALAGGAFDVGERSTEVALEEEFPVDPDAYIAQADGDDGLPPGAESAEDDEFYADDDVDNVVPEEFGFEEDGYEGEHQGGRSWARVATAIAAVALVAITAFYFFGPQIQNFFQTNQVAAHGYGAGSGQPGTLPGGASDGSDSPDGTGSSLGGMVNGTQEVSVPPQFRERVVLALRLGYLGEVANE